MSFGVTLTGSRALPCPPRRQSGIVLFIALVVWVAMMLAGTAMIRSVDTGVQIATNLAFKQNATHAGDAGIEAGLAWLVAQGSGALDTDQDRAYFANWQNAFDPETFDWTNQGSTELPIDNAGNAVRYVIHRMCALSNESPNAPNQSCVRLTGVGSGNSKTGGFYGSVPLEGTAQVYYRITTRVVGPKNTVSYTQGVFY